MREPVLENVTRRPAPVLAPWIERYQGYRFEGFEPGMHRGLPSHLVTFIISLSDPVDIARMPDASQPAGRLDAFVGGLHSKAAHIAHDGSQFGISISLSPFGTRALLGVSAGDLSHKVISLETLFGSRAEELVERLRTSPSWTERFTILDEMLGHAVAESYAPKPEVDWAWQRLVASGGQLTIGALAGEVGWSRRHLSEQFRTDIGLPPKTAARVVRFERANRLLRGQTTPNLARVAAMCGYYDQAHLDHDWADIVGCSPTEWMLEELPSVQDGDATAGR
jgi:AraC-like DNA-binding protein